MENLPLLFNQTQILDKQKDIRQDVGRARISSKAFSEQVTKIISSVELLFENAMNLLINKDSEFKRGNHKKTLVKD